MKSRNLTQVEINAAILVARNELGFMLESLADTIIASNEDNESVVDAAINMNWYDTDCLMRQVRDFERHIKNGNDMTLQDAKDLILDYDTEFRETLYDLIENCVDGFDDREKYSAEYQIVLDLLNE